MTKPKTIYVVTAGQYSDYGICAVFSTEQLATEYLGEGKDEYSRIEPYELDQTDGQKFRRYWHAEIDLETGNLTSDLKADVVSTKITLEKVGTRGSVYFLHRGGPVANCKSFISEEHARKLCAESRQEWLRAGSPSLEKRDTADQLSQSVEI